MREIMLRALPVCFAALTVGCFSMGSKGGGAPAAKSGPPPTPTHAYWQHVSVILALRPTSDDIKSNVQLIQTQTAALRELPDDDVDHALVVAVKQVIECEEQVIRVADMVDCDREKLKKNQDIAIQFADSNRRAAEAKKQLKALRDQLNDRHGGGFVAISN